MKKTMATPEQIKTLEDRIKEIFNKERIRKMDVIIANRLIEDWKKITNYKTPNIPISYDILDEKPIWQKNK